MSGLYIFFGMIASGKSTLATAFGRQHHFPVFNTDRIRKELAGLQPTDHRPANFGQGLYTAGMSDRTYSVMLERAQVTLHQGATGVVLDGSYSKARERSRILALANAEKVACLFIYCFCSEEETRKRLARRANDPQAVSDAGWTIFCEQKKHFEAPDELSPEQLIVLNTEAEVDFLLDRINALVPLQPPPG